MVQYRLKNGTNASSVSSSAEATAENQTFIVCNDGADWPMEGAKLTQQSAPPLGAESNQKMMKKFQSPPQLDSHTPFYEPYDPFVGVRIATILSGFLLSIILYAVYKTKCRRERWSQDDKQFIDRYSRVLADKWTGRAARRHAHASTRQSIARNTANWIHSQPLNETFEETGKLGINVAIGRMVFESAYAAAYPMQTLNTSDTDVARTSSLPQQMTSSGGAGASASQAEINMEAGVLRPPAAQTQAGTSSGGRQSALVNAHRLANMGLSLDTTLSNNLALLSSSSASFQPHYISLDDTESLNSSHCNYSITLPGGIAGAGSQRSIHTASNASDVITPKTPDTNVLNVLRQRSPTSTCAPYDTASAFTVYDAQRRLTNDSNPDELRLNQTDP